jgi:hypothetical protein
MKVGNAFDNVGPILKANIQPTVNYLNELIFKPLNITEDMWTSELGSVGKKDQSGDIDIALDMPKLFELFKTDDAKLIKSIIVKKLNDEGIANRLIQNNVHMSFPIQGSQNGEFVQIDLLPAINMEYTKQMHHSPGQGESKYKGAHRGNGLKSLIKSVSTVIADDAQDNEKQEYIAPDGTKYPGLRFKYISAKDDGFYYVTKSFIGKSGKIVKTPQTDKSKDKFLTYDLQEVLDLLFGKGKYTIADTFSFETIWNNILMDPSFPYKDKLDEIIQALYLMYDKDLYIDPPTEIIEYLNK